jgi:protoporphyrinogen/coproporphyrinogen III oxidase
VCVHIVVVGGGIAGLAAALRVRDRAGPAARVTIVERAGYLGGKLRTGSILGGPVELGAEAFLTDGPDGRPSAASRLVDRLGLAGAVRHPAPAPAAIAVGGVLHDIPAGTLVGVPGDLSALDGVAEPAADLDRDGGHPLLRPGEDVAVGSLIRSRLGESVLSNLVDPMLGGVYAGRADDLSLATTMPALHAAVLRAHTLVDAVRLARHGQHRRAGAAIFSTVEGGLSRLVDALAAAGGADIHTGQTVRELAADGGGWRLLLGPTVRPKELHADGVILAVPAAPTARLLAGVAPDAARRAGALDYASVALVTLALPAGTELPQRSGFLVPESDRYAIKAATFFMVKWPHLCRPDAPILVRASLGRYGDTEVLRHTDAALVDLARADLAALTGVALAPPLATLVTRWGGALPQYAPGHLSRVEAARAALPATIGLAGAALDGIGIPACVTSGETAADAVLAGVGG